VNANGHHSHPAPSDAGHSQPTSPFPSNTDISDPAWTLMVVDDDPAVRDLETEILRQEGYTVLAAQGGKDALRLAGESAAIHLLVTDFMMPEIDGIELTHRFRKVHPKMPVLLVSGSLPMIKQHTEDLERFDSLPKPFHVHELLCKVRALLDTTVPLPRRPSRCSGLPGK
jgi:DNA-binding response OmpR family regulator